MLDWPAFGNALWIVSDQLGIRPEWQLPVIYLETGGTFDPSITNPHGCVGLNQLCPATYPGYVSVPVSVYRTWPASAQLAGPVLAYWRDALKYGSIRSSTRLMLAQLGQGLLATAPSLDSVVFRSPTQEYQQNAGFDTAGKGTITVQDLADAMARQVSMPMVQAALAQAYAMRPGERVSDPVYGDDFLFVRPPAPIRRSTGMGGALLAAAAVAAAAGYASLMLYRAPIDREPEYT